MLSKLISKGLRLSAYRFCSSYKTSYEECRRLLHQQKHTDALEKLKHVPIQQKQPLRAEIYTAMGRLEEAADVYTDMLKTNSADASAYYHRGSLFRRMGRLDQALQEFNRAIGINPTLNEAIAEKLQTEAEISKRQQKKQHLSRAYQFGKENNPDMFYYEVEKALRIDPDDIEALMLMAELMMYANGVPQAIQLLQKVIRINPRQERAYHLLFHGLLNSGRLEEAQKYILHGLQQNPKSIILLRNLVVLITRTLDVRLLEMMEKYAIGIPTRQFFQDRIRMYSWLFLQGLGASTYLHLEVASQKTNVTDRDRIVYEHYRLACSNTLKQSRSVDELVFYGDILEKEGHARAQDFYIAAEKLQPFNPKVIVRRAMLLPITVTSLSAQRNVLLQDSLKTLAALLDQNQSQAELYSSKASLELQLLGRTHDAKKSIEAGLAVNAEHPMLLLLRALLFMKEGKRHAALTLLRKITDRDLQGTLFMKGRMLYLWQKYHEALFALELALLFSTPKYQYQKERNKALCLLQLKRGGQAVAIFDRIGAAVESARCYFNDLEYEVALERAKKALMEQPRSSQAVVIAGMSLYALGRWEELESFCDKSIKQQPGVLGGWLVKARYLTYKRRCEEALKLFDRCLEIQPDNAESYCYRAVCQLLMGDSKGSLENINRAVELDQFRVNFLFVRAAVFLVRKQDSAFTDQLKVCEDRLDESQLSGAQAKYSKRIVPIVQRLSKLMITGQETKSSLERAYLHFLEVMITRPLTHVRATELEKHLSENLQREESRTVQ